jgi:hypothetical protein
MLIHLKNRRSSLDKLQQQFPGAAIVDVTSRGPEPWVQFSPFYPHGDIPVPFSPGYSSMCVEGIWQGLKVFEAADVDVTKFAITTMKGLKRTTRKYGPVLGHRAGVRGAELLAYGPARHAIYLPSYRWILDNPLQTLIPQLQTVATQQELILLDYTTNGEVDDLSKPLSHAGLIKRYLEGDWPEPTPLVKT